MCWEIRQRYLPAQAHGRFLLKGEGGRAGVVWGLWAPWSWSPPLLLSAGLWYQCPPSIPPLVSHSAPVVNAITVVGNGTLWGCTCSGPDFHPLYTPLMVKRSP